MNDSLPSFIKSNQAAKVLGVHPDTLRKLDRNGKIQTIRTEGGIRLYNVQKYITDNSNKYSNKVHDRVSICYCRVSTHSQSDDLERQKKFMQEKYPTHTIISDIGSGINFKRKGLKTILDLALKGKIQELVVAHKDRLARFAFELIEYILSTSSNAKIVVLDEPCTSTEEGIVQDVLQILNVYSAKINGSRKYKNKDKKNKDSSKSGPEKNS